MQGCPRTTSKHCRCSLRPCVNTFGNAVGKSASRLRILVQERPCALSVRSCSKPARRREIDLVLVWRQDRWGRSLVNLVTTLQELMALGVGFVSLSEALDMTTPSGRALAGMLALFADYAESAIVQSGNPKLVHWLALQWCGALHNIGRAPKGTRRHYRKLEKTGSALYRPQPRLSGLRGRIFVG